jgi:hypothetical protein
MQTGRQIGFIAAQQAANSGAGAALKAQLVVFGDVGDSRLIGIADACEEVPILHFKKSHYGLAWSFPWGPSCFNRRKHSPTGSAHFP